MEDKLFSFSAYILLFLSVVFSLISLWKPNTNTARITSGAVTLAFACLTLALIQRGLAGGRLPFATMYEFTYLFAWGLLFFYLLLRNKYSSVLFTSLICLVSIIIISIGSILPSEIKPLMPALQSVWLKLHVATAIVSYGSFGISFCLGIIYFKFQG